MCDDKNRQIRIKFIYHYLFYKMRKPNGEQSFMINGKDRRIPIINMSQYPYDNLLFLYMHKQRIGTAFLIDEYHALTAAHTIYFENRFFKQAYVFQYGGIGEISIKDSALKKKTNIVVRWKCPEQFIKFKDKNSNKKLYDYALLRLDQPIHRQRYSTLLFDHQFDVNKEQVEVSGYPGEFFKDIKNNKGEGHMKKLQAFTHTDQLKQQKDALLVYNVDTSAGQSGSPVFYRHNNAKYVVGIHIYGDKYQGNQGIRLTDHHRKNIMSWMKEMYIPKLSMYQLGKNGLKDLSKELSINSGEETLGFSSHEKNAISMDATIINNTNFTAWQFPLAAQKYTEINNETITNKSVISNEEYPIFAVTYMKIQPIKVQTYLARIKNITDKIAIGLITQKDKSRFIEKKGPISGFKDYILAYMSIQDKFFRGGRIYYKGAIYPKYKANDKSLFTQEGDQIEFGVDFTYKRVFLSINGNEMLIQLIPEQFQNQSFYIYVFLGKAKDSVQIIKLGEDTQSF